MGFLSSAVNSSSEKIFTFKIQDIFTIKGVGCIVVGIVEGGEIRVSDNVYIINDRGSRRRSTVLSIENPKMGIMRVAPVGSNVGILLSSIEARDLNRGDILTNSEEL